MPEPSIPRRLPVGAEIIGGRGVHFRVWAPDHTRVAVVLEGRTSGERHETPLSDAGGGYFEALLEEAAAGTRYWFRLDEEERLYPDLASRFQPEGPHGPSEVVDPSVFRWTDAGWRGVTIEGQVIYEMHIGTFTPEGTWAAAAPAAGGVEGVRDHRARGDAGRGVPGALRLGLRRRRPVRADAALREARRFSPVRRRQRTSSAWPSSSTSSTTISDLTGLLHGVRARLTSSTKYENEWGDAAQLRWRRQRAGARVLHRQRRLLDRRVSPRRPAPRRDAVDSRQLARAHPRRGSGRRARAAAGGRDRSSSSPRTSRRRRDLVRADRAGRLRARRARGTTTSITARSSRSPGTARRTTPTTSAPPQEFVSARASTATSTRASATRGRRSRAARRHGAQPAAFVSFLENHDQVANSLCGVRIQQLSSPGRYRAHLSIGAACQRVSC